MAMLTLELLIANVRVFVEYLAEHELVAVLNETVMKAVSLSSNGEE